MTSTRTRIIKPRDEESRIALVGYTELDIYVTYAISTPFIIISNTFPSHIASRPNFKKLVGISYVCTNPTCYVTISGIYQGMPGPGIRAAYVPYMYLAMVEGKL
jgi:hypothetical protein